MQDHDHDRGAALEYVSAALLAAANVRAERRRGTSLCSFVAHQAKVSALMRRRGTRAPALVERVVLTTAAAAAVGGAVEEKEEEEEETRSIPRGFSPPSGPSQELRHFQVSQRIALITILFIAGSPAAARSCSTGILSALEVPHRRRAMSLTGTWRSCISWLEGSLRESLGGKRRLPYPSRPVTSDLTISCTWGPLGRCRSSLRVRARRDLAVPANPLRWGVMESLLSNRTPRRRSSSCG